jgi:hypothetical protein
MLRLQGSGFCDLKLDCCVASRPPKECQKSFIPIKVSSSLVF